MDPHTGCGSTSGPYLLQVDVDRLHTLARLGAFFEASIVRAIYEAISELLKVFRAMLQGDLRTWDKKFRVRAIAGFGVLGVLGSLCDISGASTRPALYPLLVPKYPLLKIWTIP